MIVEKILSILRGNPWINSVYYCSSPKANVLLDTATAPYAVLYLISDWRADDASGQLRQSCEIQLFICKPADLDFGGEENELIIEDCKEIAVSVYRDLLAAPELRVDRNSLRFQSAWDKYDVNVTGVVMRLTIGEEVGICINGGQPLPDIEVQGNFSPLVTLTFHSDDPNALCNFKPYPHIPDTKKTAGTLKDGGKHRISAAGVSKVNFISWSPLYGASKVVTIEVEVVKEDEGNEENED